MLLPTASAIRWFHTFASRLPSFALYNLLHALEMEAMPTLFIHACTFARMLCRNSFRPLEPTLSSSANMPSAHMLIEPKHARKEAPRAANNAESNRYCMFAGMPGNAKSAVLSGITSATKQTFSQVSSHVEPQRRRRTDSRSYLCPPCYDSCCTSCLLFLLVVYRKLMSNSPEITPVSLRLILFLILKVYLCLLFPLCASYGRNDQPTGRPILQSQQYGLNAYEPQLDALCRIMDGFPVGIEDLSCAVQQLQINQVVQQAPIELQTGRRAQTQAA
jgi:hypothetical protein